MGSFTTACHCMIMLAIFCGNCWGEEPWVQFRETNIDVNLGVAVNLSNTFAIQDEIYNGSIEVQEVQKWECPAHRGPKCVLSLQRKYSLDYLMDFQLCGIQISNRNISSYKLEKNGNEYVLSILQSDLQTEGDISICWRATQLLRKMVIPKTQFSSLPGIGFPLFSYLEGLIVDIPGTSKVTWNTRSEGSPVYLMADVLSQDGQILNPCRIDSKDQTVICTPNDTVQFAGSNIRISAMLIGIQYTSAPNSCMKLFAEFGSQTHVLKTEFLEEILSKHLLKTYLFTLLCSVLLKYTFRNAMNNIAQSCYISSIQLIICACVVLGLFSLVALSIMRTLPITSCVLLYHSHLAQTPLLEIILLFLYQYPGILIELLFFPIIYECMHHARDHGQSIYEGTSPRSSYSVYLWHKFLFNISTIISASFAIFLLSCEVFPPQHITLYILLGFVAELLLSYFIKTKRSKTIKTPVQELKVGVLLDQKSEKYFVKVV